MSSEPRPLRVAAISQDEALLREIAWVLEAVGYTVQTTNDFEPTAVWRKYSSADIVLYDGRNTVEPSAETLHIETDAPVCKLLFYDKAKPGDLNAWYAAGAHDALGTPLSRGELLARLRTSARYLEFERRLLNRSSHSALPGTLTRRGFERSLGKLAENKQAQSAPHTMLATSVDFYENIVRRDGEAAGKKLLHTAARSIQRVAGKEAITAHLHNGHFVTLLVGQSIAAARVIAESLAKDFGGRESRRDAIVWPTLSIALVPWAPAEGTDRVFSDALDTLHVAETSGGDCIVAHDEFSKELAAWREEMTGGNPFNHVVAQDIMEPFPAVLEQGIDQPELVASLKNAGVAVQPYVDREGILVGVMSDDAAAGELGKARAATLTEPSLVVPETIAHDASFPEIYEAFSSRGCSTLIVTADRRPLGFLTCDGFLSMIDPISTETFSRAAHPVDELGYLLVPSSVANQEAAEQLQA